jgi:Domain of unknown function (DUF4189)
MKFLPRALILASLISPLGAFAAGAIAVDEDVSNVRVSYGMVVRAESADQADKAALVECGKHGNKACQVAVRFAQCGAYAASSTHYGTGFGRTASIATTMAMNVCGTANCQIIAAQCDAVDD